MADTTACHPDRFQSSAAVGSSSNSSSTRSRRSGASSFGPETMSADDDEEYMEDEGPYDEEETCADDNGGEAEAEAEEGSSGAVGTYNARDVNDQIFEELVLTEDVALEVQHVWNAFLRAAESREAAGEAIYAAIFDSAPSIQSLFKTPRAVMAMRFMNGLNQIIGGLTDPKGLKTIVETLGFQHLDLEVTVPRVVIFRDAIMDLLQVEMGAQFTKKARDGFAIFLNYAGGAYIYVRLKFTDRLKILASSWATANNRKTDEFAEVAGEMGEHNKEGEKNEEAITSGDADAHVGEEKAAYNKKREKKTTGGWWGKKTKDSSKGSSGDGFGQGSKGGSGDVNDFKNTSVPTTYSEMFNFNSAVMGFSGSNWMNEVLASFDTIVMNVSNSYRLQEECDILSLRIAKYKGSINLAEYKAVMLASLRSLVPNDWNSAHEVAWTWLWENVQRMIKALLGKPAQQEKALGKLWASLDEKTQGYVRREVYAKFFALAPAGQDYFKQSTTRLHFIADRVVQMSLDIYKDPKKMVEDISALGLRHVGYGIPTDLFGAFVSGFVQVVRTLTDDDIADEAFRWSLSLISRILTRVINEGSTIVMKAINANSGKSLKKAVGCAPRGKRALWMLNIQVGTQSISPLLWAIQTGSLDAAKAIIVDLLTIRADRDRYYYGMDTMFERHHDIVRRLCSDAPALLPTLLDGLIWRSRVTENGTRRVNYYVKHLMVDAHGGFNKAIEWVTESGDPKLVCHPVIAMVTDMVWGRIAGRSFFYLKSWLIFTLCVFTVGLAIFHTPEEHDVGERIAVFVCRCFIYFFSLSQWLFFHIKHICQDIRAKDFVVVYRVTLPSYLTHWQDRASLLLTVLLLLMLSCEPIVHCMNYSEGDFAGAGLFTEACEEVHATHFMYSVFAMLATIMYFVLIIDLSVFSTKVSAFVLVCIRVLSELGLYLLALAFFILMFSSAVSALDHDDKDFAGIPTAALGLMKVALGMFSGEHFDASEKEEPLMVSVVVFVITTVIFLANLLIAQLNCSYASTYQDMVGFARLNRGKIVSESMIAVSAKRWEKFISGLHLEDPCEFGEGDMGVSGGIQVLEPASAKVTTVDMIRRFGGSTSVIAQWPEEDMAGNDVEDKFERLERLIQKAMKRMSSSRGGRKNGRSSSSLGQGSSVMGSSYGSQHDSE